MRGKLRRPLPSPGCDNLLRSCEASCNAKMEPQSRHYHALHFNSKNGLNALRMKNSPRNGGCSENCPFACSGRLEESVDLNAQRCANPKGTGTLGRPSLSRSEKSSHQVFAVVRNHLRARDQEWRAQRVDNGLDVILIWEQESRRGLSSGVGFDRDVTQWAARTCRGAVRHRHIACRRGVWMRVSGCHR